MTSYTLKNRLLPYKINAFRATENKAACKQFVKAHFEELKKIGVTKIASSEPTWIYDPNVIVFSLVNQKTNKLLAGMKIDIWKPGKDLPVMKSLSSIAPEVNSIMYDYGHDGIAEICGLWVSEEVSGLGMSKILIRSALSTFPELSLHKSIAFASQYTINTIKCMGFSIFSELGDNGKFFYPTKDFESYVALLHDTKNLSGSTDNERKLILELQTNPLLIRQENEKGKNTLIQYDLRIVKKNVEESILI